MSNWFSDLNGTNTPFTKIPNDDVCRNGNLTSEEKNVLVAIGSYDPCFPSLSQIVKDTGLCRGKVNSVIKQLEAQKIITKKKGSKRQRKNNTYSIHDSSQWKLLPIEKKNRRKNKQPKKRPQKSILRTGVSSHHKPPITPSKNTNKGILTNNNKDQSTIDTSSAESFNSASPDNITDPSSNNNKSVHNTNQSPIDEFESFANTVTNTGANSEHSKDAFKQFAASSIKTKYSFSDIEEILVGDGICDYWPEGLHWYQEVFNGLR